MYVLAGDSRAMNLGWWAESGYPVWVKGPGWVSGRALIRVPGCFGGEVPGSGIIGEGRVGSVGLVGFL